MLTLRKEVFRKLKNKQLTYTHNIHRLMKQSEDVVAAQLTLKQSFRRTGDNL
jgi:hypothetical protein